MSPLLLFIAPYLLVLAHTASGPAKSFHSTPRSCYVEEKCTAAGGGPCAPHEPIVIIVDCN